MSEPYVGELRMFGGNFAPRGWKFCDGSLLSISQYDVLYALIGTTYGGDGANTFAVPDLRGRVPIHQGTGPGLSPYTIGQMGGVEQVTLISTQLPIHGHTPLANTAAGDIATPAAGAVLATMGPASETRINTYIAYDGTTQVALNSTSISIAGGNQPHNNVQPTVVVNYIIALEGVFPSQP